jgi:hypothetical protein
MKNTYKVLVIKLERKGPLEYLSTGGRIIVKWILN